MAKLGGQVSWAVGRTKPEVGPQAFFVPNWQYDLGSLIYKMRGPGLILREQSCVVMVGNEGVRPTAQDFSQNPGLFSARHTPPSLHKLRLPVATQAVCRRETVS